MTENNSENGATIPEKWLQCNGRQLRKLFRASLLWLEQNHQEVNALNVFPVPDGDTGTNMLLTMRAAYKEIQDTEKKHVGKVAQELAHGALMGARGNSGVILSQIWRGLAWALQDTETATADEIADAFTAASETAYKGVMRPVEGTILTVVREGSEEAQDAVEKSADLRFLLDRVLERCQQSLDRTPELLPVLKQAGVVDAGGKGFVLILEGMMRYVHGQMDDDVVAETLEVDVAADAPPQAKAVPEDGHLEFPYDVQFILEGDDLDVTHVRDTIDSMGDSTVVVGDARTIKVHVHVKDPGQPLSYGTSLGRISDVVVENMQRQMEDIVTPRAQSHSPDQPTPSPAGDPAVDAPHIDLKPEQIGVVAIAAGPGLADIFRSLGAANIVNGGQTNNPSTEEIYQAIQDAPTNNVIVLPNNKNIILAAEAARDLSDKDVAVVPTRTVPQGISAMLAQNPDGALADTTDAMETASQHVTSGEITTATRSVTLDGVQVEEGQIIGLSNGRLCASGSSIDAVLADTLEAMTIAERELVSIYYGQDVSHEEANALASQIEALYPDVEIEVLPGGQPHYMYILGAE